MWMIEVLQKYPELALFLTLAIGFAVGKIKIGSFKIGSVAGVLLTGVLVGQLGIVIDGIVKSVFFLLFLFILGYNVGPAFFKGLKKDGIPQVIFTLIVCFVGLLTTIIVAKLFGYHAGQAGGLLSGGLTQSSSIGVAQDSILNMNLDSSLKTSLSDFVPIGYAVTYIFGTIGSVFMLSTVAPKLFKSDLVAECKVIEETQQGMEDIPNENHNKILESDVIFIGLGIVLGGLIGIPAIKIGGIALSLSTSGGALIMGLIFGYIHAKKPSIGYIPKEATWFLQHVGLAVFVAVVGINAGPSFVVGLKESGVSFFFAGVIVTLVPIIVGLLLGKYVFKWSTPVILGSVAGAMTSTASVGAVCEKADSNVPVLSYTIPYAVANIVLTVFGAIIILFF